MCLEDFGLRVDDGCLDGLLEINVEERPVEALHHELPLVARERLCRLRTKVLNVAIAALLFEGITCRRRFASHELGDTEDGVALVVAIDRTQTEASGDEATLRPPIGHIGKVPVDLVGGGVTVKLVARVDQGLDRCGVDVVHGTQVEDDGLEGWAGVCFIRELPRFRVVPRAVLKRTISFLVIIS